MFFCSWDLRQSNWAGIHHCCLPACLPAYYYYYFTAQPKKQH
jgi:hypothetical protein